MCQVRHLKFAGCEIITENKFNKQFFASDFQKNTAFQINYMWLKVAVMTVKPIAGLHAISCNS